LNSSSRNVFKQSRMALCALACGLTAVSIGCGAAPESAHTDDQGRVDDENAAIKARYPATWSIVQSFLRTEHELATRSVAKVTELYRPDVDGPAYLEFALRKGSEDAGHVIASTGGHDFPVIAWSDRGPSVVLSMQKRLQRDLSGARLFMTGPGAFVAESADGSIASGASALEPELWRSAKEQYTRARTARKIESANRAVQEWQRVAKVTGVLLPPDVPSASPLSACGDGSCPPSDANCPQCLACQGYAEELVRGADILWPPNYAQFYAAFDDGTCKVGCVPNAFAQIAGWLSHQAGDHRDGSVWGHPRVAYAFNGLEDTWAPAFSDANLAGVTTEFRKRFATLCSGNEGMTNYFPYDRISDLSGRLFNQTGAPVNTYSIYNANWDAYAMAIDNSLIQAHAPVEVNAMTDPWGNSAHAWILWGYRNDCFGEAYRVNMGWDFHEAGEWVAKGSVLSALTSGFTHGLDGSGIVVFGPQDLARDHGPITTGAGAGYCLDVTAWSAENGAIVGQYACQGGDNQLWYLDRTEMATPGWQIRNRNSGKCLAPVAGGSFNGAEVVQWTCDKGDTNTLWRIEKHGTLVALKHYPSGMCLDLDNSGGMVGDGKKIQTWECNGGPNQRFDFAR
jgi:hypothetical protein